MRRRARLLHILASAPVAAVVAVVLAPSLRALAAAPQHRPIPYVVALDPGHGGSPDNSRPDLQYDPGVIGVNGLREADLTLDLAQRVERLLSDDLVSVVMTRTDDSFVAIGPRMDAAVSAGASLFVSIHFNSFTDPSTGGSLVLYPNDGSKGFADVMGAALGRGLAPYGVVADGTQLRPELWVHATMPAVTVEGAYLTNPTEADLLTRPSFRDSLAAAITAGIENQDPEIGRRQAEIQAWNAAHPSQQVGGAALRTTITATPAAQSGDGGHTLLTLTALLLVTGAASVGLRGRVPRAALVAALAGLPRTRDSLLRRIARERRRRGRTAQRRALIERSRHRPQRRSVYDELWF